MPRPMPSLEGKFGKLVFVRMSGTKNKQGYNAGVFACDCGKEVTAAASWVARGGVKSCGCLKTEHVTALGKSGVGGEGRWAANADRPESIKRTPGYRNWQMMIQRCENPNEVGYPKYGARGIKVCPPWRKSFRSFLADMGERPSPSHSIDRIDNNGDYEPGDCRWATMREQSNNRRNTVYLDHQGRTLPLAEWAREVGLGYTTLKERLAHGWSVERALTEKGRRSR